MLQTYIYVPYMLEGYANQGLTSWTFILISMLFAVSVPLTTAYLWRLWRSIHLELTELGLRHDGIAASKFLLRWSEVRAVKDLVPARPGWMLQLLSEDKNIYIRMDVYKDKAALCARILDAMPATTEIDQTLIAIATPKSELTA